VTSCLPTLLVELPQPFGQRVTFEGPELPLSSGQRVTFFAGAKKVTKETPSRSEPPQEEPAGLRRSCAESHARLGLRTLMCVPLDRGIEVESWDRSGLQEAGLFRLRRTSCLWDSSRARRFSAHRTWARSDSERCFFGDFLCTSKESYTLAEGQRKLRQFGSYPLLRRRSGSSCFPRNSVSEDGERLLRREIESGAAT
jgi:hypothetical protein